MTESVVKLIDHAVLQPTQTDDDIRAACKLCAELGTASVCVKPSHVPLAVECLRGSTVIVSTVIGSRCGLIGSLACVATVKEMSTVTKQNRCQRRLCGEAIEALVQDMSHAAP